MARRVVADIGRLAAAISRTPERLVTSALSGWVARPKPCVVGRGKDVASGFVW